MAEQDRAIDMPQADHPASLRTPTRPEANLRRRAPETWQGVLSSADRVHLRGHWQATLASSAEIQAMANALLQAEPLLDAAAMWAFAPDRATREEAVTDFEIIARRLFGTAFNAPSDSPAPTISGGRTSGPESKTPHAKHGSNDDV